MMGVAAAVLAVRCAAGPEASPPPPRPVAAEREDPYWFIEHDARRERRQRITEGVLQVTAGALQAGLGIYVLVGVPENVDSVDIAGALNTAAGGGLILQGILGLARRGPLEAMVRDAEFDRAKRSHDAAWIEYRLARAARRGRIERRVTGSLSLVAGLTIIGLGINNLADENLRAQPAKVVLGATEIAAGLGFSSLGIRMLALPSHAEHTLETWRYRASRVRSISVSPTPGGVVVSGRF